jgi:hypothetical protein
MGMTLSTSSLSLGRSAADRLWLERDTFALTID